MLKSSTDKTSFLEKRRYWWSNLGNEYVLRTLFTSEVSNQILVFGEKQASLDLKWKYDR